MMLREEYYYLIIHKNVTNQTTLYSTSLRRHENITILFQIVQFDDPRYVTESSLIVQRNILIVSHIIIKDECFNYRHVKITNDNSLTYCYQLRSVIEPTEIFSRTIPCCICVLFTLDDRASIINMYTTKRRTPIRSVVYWVVAIGGKSAIQNKGFHLLQSPLPDITTTRALATIESSTSLSPSADWASIEYYGSQYHPLSAEQGKQNFRVPLSLISRGMGSAGIIFLIHLRSDRIRVFERDVVRLFCLLQPIGNIQGFCTTFLYF